MKKRILYLSLLTIIPLILLIGYLLTKCCFYPSKYGVWTVEITDFQTGKQVEKAEIAITELNKIYVISKQSNTIKVPIRPKKPSDTTGLYPYGYTTVTYAKGYLPRIDHHLPSGDYHIFIRLEKSAPFSNTTYTEFFHSAPRTSVGGLIYYYFKNRPGNEN